MSAAAKGNMYLELVRAQNMKPETIPPTNRLRQCRFNTCQFEREFVGGGIGVSRLD